jgi:hypothetical protein
MRSSTGSCRGAVAAIEAGVGVADLSDPSRTGRRAARLRHLRARHTLRQRASHNPYSPKMTSPSAASASAICSVGRAYSGSTAPPPHRQARHSVGQLEVAKSAVNTGPISATFTTSRKAVTCGDIVSGWRWRWDLNPRRAFTLTRFRDASERIRRGARKCITAGQSLARTLRHPQI